MYEYFLEMGSAKDQKTVLVKSYFMPIVLIYEVETYPRTKADISMLMAAEVKF
jgi:hypothetical protein